jgi:prepilin-type N-terminal cleavage/methylation domain-containing protein
MNMKRERRSKHDAFSLLELVIVVAIIAILAAIAIPRMSRGSKGAGESALSANLAVLRNAIDIFAAEHTGTYPGVDYIADQLKLYTNQAGETSASKDPNYIYGPYIRQVPPLPVGAQKGSTDISDLEGDGVGWIYDPDTGAIKANCTDSEKDDAGKQYNQY